MLNYKSNRTTGFTILPLRVTQGAVGRLGSTGGAGGSRTPEFGGPVGSSISSVNIGGSTTAGGTGLTGVLQVLASSLGGAW